MLRRKAVFAEEAEDREKQSTEAVKEDCREVSDGGSLLLHCQEWGLYELSHELICSSLWPINSEEGAGSEAMYLGGVVVHKKLASLASTCYLYETELLEQFADTDAAHEFFACLDLQLNKMKSSSETKQNKNKVRTARQMSSTKNIAQFSDLVKSDEMGKSKREDGKMRTLSSRVFHFQGNNLRLLIPLTREKLETPHSIFKGKTLNLDSLQDLLRSSQKLL
ncbi:hypothetical protein Acr_25g0005810 [Actinidia rufa]|uniref:Uncharacterized protein n=1 Tax=Actinidia rufa TaxID=165716 RepID=A0A7J0GZF2_9ERIC|nr:hypothetical protein Acr_25g0005810 [Actinidia rufa]